MTRSYTFGYIPPRIELAERKGRGHPDTLADGVAEAISRAYSRYCLDQFGDVLHHNCDKIALLGGQAQVRFGRGELTSPVRLIINGRFSTSFGGVTVPWEDIAEQASRDYLKRALPAIDPQSGISVHQMASTAPSPGVLTDADPLLPPRSSAFMFAPRDRNDLTQSTYLESNDTSAGCGYAPYNTAHMAAMTLEKWVTSDKVTAEHPYIGRDVKVMAYCDGENLRITACIPFIAAHTPTLNFYQERLDWLQQELITRAAEITKGRISISIDLNCRDVPKIAEIYLTAIGSSIESGDEGVVGRGNRFNGVIHFTGPMSLEAYHGKNPIYHTGKIYTVLADRLAHDIADHTDRHVTTHFVSQTGRDLRTPWVCAVSLSGGFDKATESYVDEAIEGQLTTVSSLSAEIITGAIVGL